MKPKVLMVNLGLLDEEDQEERAKALADTGALIIIPSSLSSSLCILYSLQLLSDNQTHSFSPSSSPSLASATP